MGRLWPSDDEEEEDGDDNDDDDDDDDDDGDDLHCTGEDKYRDPASLSPLVEHVTVTSLLIKSLKPNCYCLLFSKISLLKHKPLQAPLLNVRTATKY